MEQAGIRVLPQVCGDLEAVISAFRKGTLRQPEFVMPGCCGWRWKESRRRVRCRRGAHGKVRRDRAAWA